VILTDYNDNRIYRLELGQLTLNLQSLTQWLQPPIEQSAEKKTLARGVSNRCTIYTTV